MIIWMQHPQHGKHPAQPHEVDTLKKAGWSPCPPKLKAVVTQTVDLSERKVFNDVEVIPRTKLSLPKKGK